VTTNQTTRPHASLGRSW